MSRQRLQLSTQQDGTGMYYGWAERDGERVRIDVLPPAHLWDGDVMRRANQVRCQMNNKLTSRMVLHVPQEDMVTLVAAARASRQSIHDFVLQAAAERAKRVLRKG